MAPISKPGVYDVSDSDYHADNLCAEPTLSSSIIKVLDQQTPGHAWYAHPRLNPNFQREDADKFDIGTACHELVLRGDSARFAVINAGDYRTKEAQQLRREARATGRIPLLVEQAARTEAMARAVRRQLAFTGHEAAGAFSDGLPEQTLIWQQMVPLAKSMTAATAMVTWSRARLDWLPNKRTMFWDFKSTDGSAEPESWARRMIIPMGYDIQAAWYLRGIRAVLGIENAQFGFIVAEQSEPYALSAVGVPPHVIANAERKIERALALWSRGIANRSWPMYDSRIYWGADVPPWETARQEQREYVGKTELEIARKMQEPL